MLLPLIGNPPARSGLSAVEFSTIEEITFSGTETKATILSLAEICSENVRSGHEPHGDDSSSIAS